MRKSGYFRGWLEIAEAAALGQKTLRVDKPRQFKSLISAELLERKSSILEDYQKQSSGKIASGNRDNEGVPSGVFENRVRTGLAEPLKAMPSEETNEFAGRDHLVQRESDCFSIHGASRRNGLAFPGAVLKVETHGLQDTLVVNGFAKALDAGQVIAVRVVALTFSFLGNRITVKYADNKNTMMGKSHTAVRKEPSGTM